MQFLAQFGRIPGALEILCHHKIVKVNGAKIRVVSLTSCLLSLFSSNPSLNFQRAEKHDLRGSNSLVHSFPFGDYVY